MRVLRPDKVVPSIQ